MTVDQRYSAHREVIKLSIALICIAAMAIYWDWLWRSDRLIYDIQSGLITQTADADIVIVAIDEISLRKIGRWPWSRRVHAQLVDNLTTYNAKTVILDIIFAEANKDDLEGDAELAKSIALNGRTILPVLLEQSRLQGQFVETLPLPKLIQAGAKMGHVHVELDADGIARETYLYEGLGNAQWPHIGLTALNKNVGKHNSDIPANHNNSKFSATGQWSWIRDEHFLIPFVGPPGSFNTISFWNVLNKQVIPSQIENKIILVGATAMGLGDSLPTPVSGLAQPMAGVEINANIIQALKSNSLIHRIDSMWYFLLTSLFILTSLLLYPYLTPSTSLALMLVNILIAFTLSTICLRWLHVWIPLSAPIAGILTSYPLWTWQRLEFTIKSLNRGLEQLSYEIKDSKEHQSISPETAFEFLVSITPVRGLSVNNIAHHNILSLGEIKTGAPISAPLTKWQNFCSNYYCRQLTIDNTIYYVIVHWNQDNSFPDQNFTRLLSIFLHQLIPTVEVTPRSTMEVTESRIRQVQAATEKLANLRRFIADSLGQMANGVLVIDNTGHITLSNRQANRYLSTNSTTELLHQPILPIVKNMTLAKGENWSSAFNSVLLFKREKQLQARNTFGKDLIVEIKPLNARDRSTLGFILNISDISDIKKAERKRNEAIEFLSHDLRSPLVSVLALLEQAKLSNNYKEKEIAIEKYINKTIQLAEDFVYLSRVESNDNIQFSDIDISDVVDNAIDGVWDQAKKKNITFTKQLEEDAWLSGNAAILERVVTNLLSNAIKYSDDHSSVQISVKISDCKICCCVVDSGIGIAEDKIPFLFQRYSQAQQNQNQKSGIGLGLAFVIAAVKRHDGEVNVSSSPGKGASFCFTLPIKTLNQ